MTSMIWPPDRPSRSALHEQLDLGDGRVLALVGRIHRSMVMVSDEASLASMVKVWNVAVSLSVKSLV